MSGVLVTGTDTGVGKTVVATALLLAARRLAPARPVRYWKPWQTGCPPDDDGAIVVRDAALSAEEVLPSLARLRAPVSPFEAARLEGVRLEDAPSLPSAPPDAILVVEGAGGLLVPITGSTTIADAAGRWRLPLVVVARPDVGTINHSALTVLEARARGLAVAALVFSGVPTAAVVEAVRAIAGDVAIVLLPRATGVDAGALARFAEALAAEPAIAAALRGAAAPDGDDLAARDRRVSWHPYSAHGAGADAPLAVVGASEATLTLADGRRVLDGISSWWTCLHGHGRPEIARAVARQAARLDHVQFAGATHAPAVELAERLVALAPRGAGPHGGLTRVFFSDDGSTAVETALKAALAYHARRGDRARTRFLAHAEGYHGDTAGAMTVSADGTFTRDFASLRTAATRVPAPVRGATLAASTAALDAALAREGERCAAIVVEPVLLGAAGMLVTPPEWLAVLRDRATRVGALLIADEVLTGFGRTGATFACDLAGVVPDLLCVSKALTGGTLALAATLATEEVFAAFATGRRADAFLHGHSYTANPVACAAALAALDLLDDAALARARAIGERIGARLAPLRGAPGVRDVRGVGLLRAVEIEDASGDGYLGDAGPRMAAAALERGVLLRPLGPVLYALPPLCTTDAECDAIGDAIRAGVEAALATR